MLITIKRTISFTLLITCASFICHSSYSQNENIIEVRFSHVDSDDSPRGKMARYFQNLIRERIGTDKMFVTVFPEGRIVDDVKAMDALLIGKIEIAAPSLSLVKQHSKRFQVFDLPFIFSGPSAAEAFLQGVYAERLMNSLKSSGFTGLGYMIGGMGQISSDKKVVTPQDLQGLSVRTTSSEIEKSWIQNMGALAVELPFSRVSRALRKGRVDAQMSDYSSIQFNRFYKYQQYILESNHTHLGYAVITSQKFLNNLPEDLRDTFQQAMQEAIQYGNALAKEQNAIDRLKLIDSGTTITRLSVDQRQQWIKAMLPLWKQKENEIGRELIQAAASQR
ncbi:MAG: DctP family TRAP transporter solute-binding subunit [Arenicella sp.]